MVPHQEIRLAGVRDAILRSFRHHIFAKVQKCHGRAHSTFIGLWSSWWIDSFTGKGYVLDGASKLGSADRHADLLFQEKSKNDLIGRGVLEVETHKLDSKHANVYKEKAETLLNYLNEDEERIFGILMVVLYPKEYCGKQKGKNSDYVCHTRSKNQIIKVRRLFSQKVPKGKGIFFVVLTLDNLWDFTAKCEIIQYSNTVTDKVILSLP